jgi:peptidoglycan/LPS O-acetylase OafA/YrhL
MDSKNQRYEPGLDHIRAAAAVWIVLYHSFQILSASLGRKLPFSIEKDWMHTNNPLVSLLTEGHTAVGLFMVLSGFVLARAAEGREILYGKFLKNRLLRIYPLFVVVLVVGVASAKGSIGFTGLLTTLLPIGNVPDQVVTEPFSHSIWAIPVEFQFYLVFPFLVTMLNRNGPKQLGLILLSAIIFRMFIYSSGGDITYASYFSIVGRIDEFLIGMLAAHAYRSWAADDWTPWLFLPAFLASTILLFGYHKANGYVSSAPWKAVWPTVEGAMWGAVIICYLPLSKRLWPWLSQALAGVGAVSFSMYLLHYMVLSVVADHAGKIDIDAASVHWTAFVAGLALVLPITVVISRLTYFAIEKPFLDMRVRYLAPLPVTELGAVEELLTSTKATSRETASHSS